MAVELPNEIQRRAETLLAALDPHPGEPVEFEKLKGGANNQVYRLQTTDSQFCLKWYFSHPADPRNRLAHENQFLKYAWSAGIRNIPQSLGISTNPQLALLTYVKGGPFIPGKIQANHIQQAIQFLDRLNQECWSEAASTLPIAAEACFSWQDHIEKVQQRIDRLTALPRDSDIHQSAADFIKQKMLPSWEEIRANLEHRLNGKEMELGGLINRLPRVVSPSDFGFHNALQDDGGNMFFIDFEYAGLDSPVKLICDFFHQPQVPVPSLYLNTVIERVKKLYRGSYFLDTVIDSYLPVYGIKWCCILLNEFLPTDKTRRAFSQGRRQSLNYLEAQLTKAHQKLASIKI